MHHTESGGVAQGSPTTLLNPTRTYPPVLPSRSTVCPSRWLQVQIDYYYYAINIQGREIRP